MALMEWTNALSVEIASIDAQHHRLVDLINKLHEAMLQTRTSEVIKSVLDELLDYTKTHFAYEEKMMLENGYPDFEAHKQIHDQLTARVVELDEKLAAGETVLGMDIMAFLKEWLTNHIMGVDKKYSPFMHEHGVE